MPFRSCSICRKSGAFKCEHGKCTHASYGDVLQPPVQCSRCTQKYLDSDYVLVTEDQDAPEATSENEASRAAKSDDVDVINARGACGDLELKQQSCWRCQLHDKECDSELPCKECTLQEEDKRYLACQRDRIHDRIRGAIPDMDLGTGNWFLPGVGRTNFRISVTFDPPAYKYIYKDFKKSDASRDTCLTQPPISIIDFLEQFHDINWHWKNCYERSTVELMRYCAQYQAKLLVMRNDAHDHVDQDDDEDVLLIALALRCMALTHEIFRLDSNVPYLFFDRGETSYECSTYHESDPYMDIWTTTTDWNGTANASAPGRPLHRDSLPAILEQLLEKTQRILFRRDPKDWPMLLCTLCIFALIKQNFNPGGRWMSSLKKAGLAINHVNSVLCQLFEMITEGNLPLSDDWVQEEYTKQTEDEASNTCMRDFHHMWQECSYYQTG